MFAHENWLSTLTASGETKTLTRSIKKEAANASEPVDITIMENKAVESSAQPTGWAVSISYTNAPTQVLFNQVLPSKADAERYFNDFVKAASAAQSALNQGEFDKAEEETQKFKDLCNITTGSKPIVENDPSTQPPQ